MEAVAPGDDIALELLGGTAPLEGDARLRRIDLRDRDAFGLEEERQAALDARRDQILDQLLWP